MIPVLAVPVLHPDRVARMLASVDVPCVRCIVIDNGGRAPDLPGVHVIRLPANLGVAASWNLALKVTIASPWWAIVNDDIEFAPGDLARLAEAMEEPGARIVTLDGFAAFGINRAALDRIGFFDEAFHPAYCEDADYEYRARLAGVPIVSIPARLRHARSSTIADPAYGRQNDRTYPENRRYFIEKWGGDLRGGETFDEPFDGEPRPLSPARLRVLGWQRIETAAVEPRMERR